MTTPANPSDLNSSNGTGPADDSAPTADPATDPGLSPAVVVSCASTVEAALVRSRLEAAGIEAFLPEEQTPQIFWCLVPSPLEPVTVRVAARDLEAARAVLAGTD